MLLERLTALLRARLAFIVGFGMPTSAYAAVRTVLDRQSRPRDLAPDHPLTFCATVCIEKVAGWLLRAGGRDDQVIYCFEQGDPNQSEIRQLMDMLETDPRLRSAYRLAEWSFGDKSVPGLQVADLVAYESSLWGKREVLPLFGESPQVGRPRRRSLEALASIPMDIGYARDVEDVLDHIRRRRDSGSAEEQSR